MEERQYIVHPYKFAMWIFLLTLIMIFGGLTSAYIVSRSFIEANKLIVYQMPSVLIEVGFLTNPREMSKLQSRDYLNNLAFVISNGVIQFLKKQIAL